MKPVTIVRKSNGNFDLTTPSGTMEMEISKNRPNTHLILTPAKGLPGHEVKGLAFPEILTPFPDEINITTDKWAGCYLVD